jgi:hypothetical protein
LDWIGSQTRIIGIREPTVQTRDDARTTTRGEQGDRVRCRCRPMTTGRNSGLHAIETADLASYYYILVRMCAYILEYLLVPNDLFELIFWVHACTYQLVGLCLSHLCRETTRTVSIHFFWYAIS